MADEISELLTRVLNEVVDGRRALENRIEGVENSLGSFRNETLTNFDGTYQSLERLESESQAIAAALSRLEKAVEDERSRAKDFIARSSP